MAKQGMGFRLTLAPFNVVGTVGGTVRLSAHPDPDGINSREDFDALIEALECIRDEVSRLNGYVGPWDVAWRSDPEIPFSEEQDGIPV